MIEVRTFVEMPHEAAHEERIRLLCRRGPPLLLGEEILFVDDRVVGQHTDRFGSGGVQGFILGLRQTEQLRKCNFEGGGDVCTFAYDAVFFDAQQREPTLQTDGFKQASHELRI